MKLHDSIGPVHPMYRFNPKVKVGLGYIHKSNIITLNYHHLFSVYGKLAANPDEPYNFKGYPEQGFVTIGIMHAI